MNILNELVELAKRANVAGQGTSEMVDFRVVANPDNILAIAEAFRALGQRAEAAEEKLAELENQEPIGRVDRGEANDNNEYPGVRVVCLHEQADWINFQDGTELFLRPAPAVSLAELVPGEYTSADIPCAMTDTIQAEMDGWNACRSEMLLKIEGAK